MTVKQGPINGTLHPGHEISVIVCTRDWLGVEAAGSVPDACRTVVSAFVAL